jgi:hypothetical protein
MKPLVKGATIAAGALAGGLAGAALLSARAWDRTTARMVGRLAAGHLASGTSVYDRAAIEGLPAPVVRYFDAVLTPGQRLVQGARAEHAGEFRTSMDARWSAFRSVQHFWAVPPGFVWDARVEMVPLLAVRVRDAYIGGRACMLGKVAAVIPVVDAQGTPELASGALHRYLAESAWLPTALLPREGLAWTAIDDSTARVTLTDSGITVSLDVRFAATGEIARVEAERYRDVNGVGVPTPFVGHFRDYATVHGLRVPVAGEVEWVLPEGRFTYWRGRITRIDYEFAR